MKAEHHRLSFVGLFFWFLANSIAGSAIGLVIGLLLPEADIERIIVISILFGNAVGFASGLSALYLLPWYRRFPLVLDILLRVLTLIGGGLFGSLLVIFAYPFLLLYQGKYILTILAVDSLVSLIVGSVLYAYDRMRQQLEESGRQLEEKHRLEARLRELAAQAELKALKAQINPHFLFNTLNSISALIVLHPSKAEETIHRLAELLRYVLDSSGKDWVPLFEELCFLDGYLAIEQARFGERLAIEKLIDPASEKMLIPSLILQPLVENAVKHGVEPMIGGGTVSIATHCNAATCLISISDDGPGMEQEQPLSRGHGLANVSERLQLLYQGRASMIIRNREKGGTEVVLTVPMTDHENSHSHS